MTKESRLAWGPLKVELDKLGWHYQRLEDKLTPGIPDLNIHIPKRGDVWVELKCISLPLYPIIINTKICIGLRPEQYIWLRDAAKAGRKCCLVARIGPVWYIWNDAASWEMAKHLCCSKTMLAMGTKLVTAATVLTVISNSRP